MQKGVGVHGRELLVGGVGKVRSVDERRVKEEEMVKGVICRGDWLKALFDRPNWPTARMCVEN